MQRILTIGLASALALATAAPALAQYQPTPQYQRDLNQYQNDQSRYEDRREAYEDRKAAYDAALDDFAAARSAYDVRHQQWQRARDDYDRRYGAGSYTRAYGPAPTWDEAYWGSRRSAGSQGVNTAYTSIDCTRNNNGAVAGGIIGALAGAALGSNVAANGRGAEGAVLGAVVGGAIGAGVGNANDKYKCDRNGPYFSYNETISYRESRLDRRRNSGRYDYSYYTRQRCRLAAAPIDSYARDYRYVRVCPDREGRYRITG